jgi:hypothetical protein
MKFNIQNTKYNLLRFLGAVLLYVSLATAFVYAQSTQIQTKLDTNKILIGDQIKFTIKVTTNTGNKVSFPLLKDTISKNIEVVNTLKPDTIFSNDKAVFSITQNYVITSFDSGYYALPPQKIYINADSAKPLFSDALLLEVQTLAVDTTKAIKTIKEPMTLPFSIYEAIPYVAGFAVLALLLYLVFRYLKNRKYKVVVHEKPIEIIPAHIIALQKLEEIKAQKLWQNGDEKTYHILISETIRTYIENRYNVAALEQTTDEIIYSLRNKALTIEQLQKLKELLTIADMVKFAKEIPMPNENVLCIDNAFYFVESSKIIVENTTTNDV